ncbi:MAG: hypothetical protein B0D88_08560, partial [Candidatus Sedimenticola endophacoides]
MSIHALLAGRYKLTLIAAALLMAGCNATNTANIKPVYRVTGDSRPTHADDAYTQGKRLFAKGLYGSAIEQFSRQLAENPKSVQALNGLGASYDQLGRYQIAMRYYYRALELDPDSPLTLNNLGYSLALQGRKGQARELLALALRNDPANQYANSNIRMIEDTLPRQADVGTDAVAAAQPATTPETDRTEPRHTPDTRWADRPWPEPITADTQTPGTETPITGTETADTGRGTETPMASRTDSAAPLITGWSDSQWLAAEPTPPRTAPPADPSADGINTARAEPVSGPARALEPTREAAPELTQALPREQQTHTPLPTRVPTL